MVFLLNPNGILFGPGAQVNVGGLVASTLGLSDADFASGHYLFTNGGHAGSVMNEGAIQAGNVALIGPEVANNGTIRAPGGGVAFAAGDAVTVNLLGSGLLTAHVDKAALRAAIQNHGKILADGGQMQLLADAVRDSLIDTDGVVQAKSLINKAGHIYLSGGANGTVTVSGTLDASGAEAGAQGGAISVLGKQVGLLAGAKLDASGDAGDGTVLVGGNWHGEGPEQNASATYMDPQASIRADATGAGNGGQVVLWSNDYTGFFGNIAAKGGPFGGAGGHVETSSHNNLQAFGNVDTSAAAGPAGSWLLDPTDVTIVSGSTNTNDTDSSGIWTPTTNTAQIGVANIDNDLNAGTNVTIDTASAGTATGNITQNSGAAIGKTAGGNATLTLNAAGSITLNDNIASSSGTLGVTLNANGGAVSGAGNINTNGGLLTINAASGCCTLSGVISGTGGLTTSGAGTVVLTGNNTYTGATTISAGTLQIGNGGTTGTLGTGNVSVASGAELAFDIGNMVDNGYQIQNTISGAGSLAFFGPDKSIVSLWEANTYTGGTTIQSGIVNLASDTAFGTGPVTMTGGAIRSTGGGHTFANDFTLSGTIGLGFWTNISGNVTLAGNTTITPAENAGGSAFSGAINLGSYTLATGDTGPNVTAGGNAGSWSGQNFTLSGVISGTGGITQGGAETLILGGASANTYSGATTVNEGVLQLTSGNQIGDSNAVPVASGATFDVNGQTDTVGSIAGAGSITLGSGALTVGGDNTSPAFSGTISGSGSFSKTGTGTQTLTGANTYTGATTIGGGTLQIGNGGTTCTLGTGAVTDNGTLTFDRSDTPAVSNAIGGSGNVIATGGGTLTLSGSNSYSGGTTVSNGTLQTVATTAAGTGTVTLGDANTASNNVAWLIAGSAEPANNIVVSSNGTGTATLGSYSGGLYTIFDGNVQIDRNVNIVDNTGDRTSFNGVISGTGNIAVSGTRVTFGNDSNTDTGAITINSGSIFQLDESNVAQSNTSIVNNGFFWLNGLSETNPIIQSYNGSGATTEIAGGGITDNGTLEYSSSANQTFSGAIGGSGSLTKDTSGASTLTLSGSDSFTSSATVNAGTLVLNNAALARRHGLTISGLAPR